MSDLNDLLTIAGIPGKKDTLVTESMGTYDDNVHPESWAETEEKPVNAVYNKQDDIEFHKPKMDHEPNKGLEDVEEPKIKVPASVKQWVSDKLAEVKKDIADLHIVSDESPVTGYLTTLPPAEDLKMRNLTGWDTILTTILNYLNDLTVHNMKMLQTYIPTVSSDFYHQLPDDLVLFINRGGNIRTLKSYIHDVKVKNDYE